MALEDVLVLDGVRDGVFVEFLGEDVLGGAVGGLLAVDLLVGLLLALLAAAVALAVGVESEVAVVVIGEVVGVGAVADDKELHEGERRAIVPLKGVYRAEGLGGLVDVRGGDLVKKAGKLAVRERNRVQSLEFLAEVGLQRVAVADIRPMGVLEAGKGPNEVTLDISLFNRDDVRA